MKKTAKGREVSLRVRVTGALADRPTVWAADERLPEMLIDQPTPGSKSARNLESYLRRNGGPLEISVRAYLQDDGQAIRLFGPEGLGKTGPQPGWREDRDDGGYQGSVHLASRPGREILRLLENADS